MDMLFFTIKFLLLCQAAGASLGEDTDGIEETAGIVGLSPEAYQRLQDKARTLRTIWAQYNHEQPPSEPDLSSVLFGDIIYSETMQDYLISQLEHEHHTLSRRRRRKVMRFDKIPNLKWPGGVVPYVMKTFSSATEAMIRAAIRHWEEETCVRLYELSATNPDRDDHLVFTDHPRGCFAYYGRTGQPQQVNVDFTCTTLMGYAVHEIGHSLAFFHEQSRYDRDEHVRLLYHNIQQHQLQNFKIHGPNDMQTYGLPYDMASVMHYSAKSFSVDRSSKDTIVALDPLYQNTMGQRLALSFLDTKAANYAYCNDSCSTSTIKCERGGYPDPNDCTRCKCPEVFEGSRCERIAPSTTPVCQSAGEITVSSEEKRCIRVGPYASGTSCTWLLKAQDSCRIKFWFEGPFDVLCSSVSSGPSCYHYVGVYYESHMERGGPRFCCSTPPSFEYVVSEFNEIAAAFRSPYDESGSFGGFTMCYSLHDAECLEPAKGNPVSFTTTSRRPDAVSKNNFAFTTTSYWPPSTRPTNTKWPVYTTSTSHTTVSTEPPSTTKSQEISPPVRSELSTVNLFQTTIRQRTTRKSATIRPGYGGSTTRPRTGLKPPTIRYNNARTTRFGYRYNTPTTRFSPGAKGPTVRPGSSNMRTVRPSNNMPNNQPIQTRPAPKNNEEPHGIESAGSGPNSKTGSSFNTHVPNHPLYSQRPTRRTTQRQYVNTHRPVWVQTKRIPPTRRNPLIYQ